MPVLRKAGEVEMKHNVPIQSLIDHIKTAIDVDPWAKEMVEDLLKEQNTVEHALDILREHGWKETEDAPYANEQERHPVIVCPHCGKRVKWK